MSHLKLNNSIRNPLSLVHSTWYFVLCTLHNFKLSNLLTFQLITLFTIGCSLLTNGQTIDPKAMQLLDNAIVKVVESGNASIQFEAFAYGLTDAKQIFTLPVYKITRGGYLYLDNKKYEMQLGAMKTLSDGKVMVAIDEVSKTMYVDSVRATNQPDSLIMPEIQKIMSEHFGDATISYLGQEVVNGKNCHKVKASFTKENSHVYYWIDLATEHLYLMAEWQNNAYDVYWVKAIAKAPIGYNYSVQLPKKEVENYYGYHVIDNRFMNEQLK